MALDTASVEDVAMTHYCSKCNAIQEFAWDHDSFGPGGEYVEVYACMVCGHQIEFAVA